MRTKHYILIGLGGFALPTVLYTWGAFNSVATAPQRVVSRTFETDNILQNYEWFFNTNANYSARAGQISEYKALLANESDASEKQQLRIELSAMRMSCRELATTYNANSEKQNRALFKSRGLPATLSQEECDA